MISIRLTESTARKLYVTLAEYEAMGLSDELGLNGFANGLKAEIYKKMYEPKPQHQPKKKGAKISLN